MNVFLILVLTVMLAIAVLSLVRVTDLFATIVLLAVISSFNVALLALLGAADVAFMEAVVGVAVSTLFFMALIRRIDPDRVTRRRAYARWGGVVATTGLAGTLLLAVDALPVFGDHASPASVHVSPAYVARSYPEIATPNVVTAVLGDFRGFDTLIETSVVMTAAMACILLLGRRL